MRLGNQVEWALHCCVVLAGLPEGRRLSTKVLAEFHGIPKEYLSKALQALSAAGIVEGSLGPTGGYRLTRPADQVTFLEVVEAVEGDGTLFVCKEIRDNNPCLGARRPLKNRAPCEIARVMWRAEEKWRAELGAVRLADVLDTLEAKLPATERARSAAWLAERS